jgi:hypothetical protein
MIEVKVMLDCRVEMPKVDKKTTRVIDAQLSKDLNRVSNSIANRISNIIKNMKIAL